MTRLAPTASRPLGLVTRVLLALVLALGLAAVGVWGSLLLWYATPAGEALRLAAAGGFALASLVAVVATFVGRWRPRVLAAYALLCLAPIALWTSLEPRQDRDWAPELAVLPRAEFDGDIVTVRNIRDFEYRTETDFTPRYYDRRFDLRELQSVDIVTSYWMGPAIAHVFVSFGFPGDDYLAVSIEVRKPKGEGYSTLKGFFRQYEVIYAAASERDVIRLRTNVRRDPPEDVYVYRLEGSGESGRRLFLEYMRRINELATTPEFYNTLTTNCTTAIWKNAHVAPDRVPLDWKILASGYVPRYLYEQGRLVTHGLSFPELQRRAHVNGRARVADGTADFSRRIRE